MDNLSNQQQQDTPKKQWVEPEMEELNINKTFTSKETGTEGPS